MPSGGENPPWPADGLESNGRPESAAQYRQELQAMVDGLRNFACIVVWVPFNEAWGQFDTEAVTSWLKQYDPDSAGDLGQRWQRFRLWRYQRRSLLSRSRAHRRQKNRAPRCWVSLAALDFPLSGHTWQDEKNWGYRSFHSADQLTTALPRSHRKTSAAGGVSPQCCRLYTNHRRRS